MPKQDQEFQKAVSSVENELKRIAGAGAEVVREKAESEADAWSSRFGERAATVADALSSAGDAARGKEDWFANAAESLSNQIKQLAQASQGKSGKEILRDAEHMARERPAMVMGAAVLSGLALGRLLRSSLDDPEEIAAGAEPAPRKREARSRRGGTRR